ncbi:MAG TPA: SDR family oxidoreductase [Terricaulis sp.]|nr:SDR family oxidoreductase [Terricaulis sp.]
MAVCLITGANRGIGLELARQLAARGDSVIAACRTSSPALDALGARVESGVEVSDAASVADLAKRLAGQRLDVLINNAGVLRVESLDAMNFDSIAQQFEVNAMGPLRVTSTLAPLLAQGAKVAIITSRMGSMGDNGDVVSALVGPEGPGTWLPRSSPRMSKAAVNAAGVSLARDLKGRGIPVGLFHPGMVATEMTGKNGIPPEEAARGVIARIDALSLETSGKFVHAVTGEELPW